MPSRSLWSVSSPYCRQAPNHFSTSSIRIVQALYTPLLRAYTWTHVNIQRNLNDCSSYQRLPMHRNMRLTWNFQTSFWSIALNRSNPGFCLTPSFQSTTHSRSYARGRPPLTSDERKKRKEERLAEHREQFRLKYRTDHEFRERTLQYGRERYAINPEFRKRWHTNTGYREKHARVMAEYWKNRKLTEEPGARDVRVERINNTNRSRYKNDSDYKWLRHLRTRLESPRFREEVVWKTHKPVAFQTKMDYRCFTCGHKRYKGLKLWWRRKENAEDEKKGGDESQIGTERQDGDGKYDCFRCFVADRAASAPIYMPPDMKPLPERGLKRRVETTTQNGRLEDQAEDKSQTGDKPGPAT